MWTKSDRVSASNWAATRCRWLWLTLCVRANPAPSSQIGTRLIKPLLRIGVDRGVYIVGIGACRSFNLNSSEVIIEFFGQNGSAEEKLVFQADLGLWKTRLDVVTHLGEFSILPFREERTNLRCQVFSLAGVRRVVFFSNLADFRPRRDVLEVFLAAL